MPIRGSPNGATHTRPQPGRDRSEQVVAINRNRWSQSIGTGGRDQSECAHTVQNVRNLASNHWKPWLKTGQRCLVPATAFSEYQDGPSPKDIVWFARPAQGTDTRPLFFFPGIWRPWEGERGPKTARVAGVHKIFAFLTAEPNAIVAPVHAKAMPVILTTEAECDQWLDAEPVQALELQRPAPADVLTIVARGKARKDEG